jgi:hypothetical protein
MHRFAVLAALLLVLAPNVAVGVESQPPAASGSAAPATEAPPAAKTAPAEKPDVLYDPGLLPDPVRAMRDKILEAALSGDLEKLKIVVQTNEMPPAFSFGENQTDPIAAMKEQSNDGEGREVMAILAEVLEAGYVHVDKGTPQEMFVWPYFAQYPITELTPAQTIELFKIVTSFEYNEMKEFGAYNFYRVGIGPDGTWHFFVAGD